VTIEKKNMEVLHIDKKDHLQIIIKFAYNLRVQKQQRSDKFEDTILNHIVDKI
jgi:hypothetical protein